MNYYKTYSDLKSLISNIFDEDKNYLTKDHKSLIKVFSEDFNDEIRFLIGVYFFEMEKDDALKIFHTNKYFTDAIGIKLIPTSEKINLFQRNFDQIEVKKQFEKQGKEIFERTRPNALFLSVVAQFNGKIATNISLLFTKKINVLSGLHEHLYHKYTMAQFQKDPDPIIQLIKQLDLDIYDIILEFNRIKTIHKKYNDQGEIVSLEKFDLNEDESEGTKKLFAFAGPILETLTNGKVLVIDELDAKLHPLITQTLINLFNSKTTNPKNAQLIFTTHDTNLLNNKIFRLDQIWFTEKNNQGASDLYSLIEYKVSSDASLESDYIKGKYGAIPFIGNLEQLFIE